MPARRCTMCNRNFDVNVFVCPRCGERTWHLKRSDPDQEEERDPLPVGRVVRDNRVIDYRFEVLERVGYSNSQALVLAARSDVDLHLACDLLARGCDPATAFDILS